MKEYVKLSIDETAYYSGNTYYEKVFLPIEVWEEIKGTFGVHTYLSELDGKHSETKAKISVEEYTEKHLETYIPQENDGETLFYHVYEYLDEDKYDNEYLYNIQQEVEAYRQVEEMTIKFKTSDKDKIMELLKDYII